MLMKDYKGMYNIRALCKTATFHKEINCSACETASVLWGSRLKGNLFRDGHSGQLSKNILSN